MVETVRELEIGVIWDPNAPRAVFVQNDLGVATLALRPRPDDEDSRPIVLRWSEVAFASAGAPNDEAVDYHRFYGKGLERVTWIGQVSDSELVASVTPMTASLSTDAVRALDHYVVLTKETTIEVVARALTVERLAGEMGAVALAALYN